MRFTRTRKRVAISEVMGSLIMIGITLIAGAGAFGFVNGQTGIAAGQIGAGVANNVNFLREKESIVLVNFDNNTGLSVYMYNNGVETLTVASLLVQGPTCLGAVTNCVATSQGNVVVTCSGSTCTVTGTATITPVTSATCATKNVAGLSSIAVSVMVRATVKLGGCNFSFAKSPTLPATTAPPLTNAFTITVLGQFGSTASTIKTR